MKDCDPELLVRNGNLNLEEQGCHVANLKDDALPPLSVLLSAMGDRGGDRAPSRFPSCKTLSFIGIWGVALVNCQSFSLDSKL